MPDTTALDHDLGVLRANARTWVTTPLADKRQLLLALRTAVAESAQEWVRTSCAAKGIAADSPVAGEEWGGGPYATLSQVTALIDTLRMLEAGRNPLDGVKARTLPTGQVALRIFPYNVYERLLFFGHTGELWLRPGISLEQARAGVARRLRDTSLPGEVALVLGAGNFTAIPAQDVLTKLYLDNAVVLLKLSPVNGSIEPVLRRVFAPFIDRGFVQITTGGADVGSYLVYHPEVDTIHITGSAASHDAIVFGPGAEGAARKAEHRPLLTKPITSELGGVGPAIMVPGRWSEGALRFQAEHLATQRLMGSGFVCVATQVAVVSEDWPQAEQFVDYLRQVLREAPVRPAYYPGAADRQQQAVQMHPKAELLGGDENCPRTLLTDVDATADAPVFGTEYFAPVLGVTSVPGAGAAEFLDNAVDFCNQRLAGTLGANVFATPATLRSLGAGFEPAIARLRYGTMGINCWTLLPFLLPRAAWAAFPGHDLADVGSGIGTVHNALLLDPAQIERSVVRAPFHPRPKPGWFVTNRTAHITGERITRFAANPSLAKLLPAAASSLRG